MNLTIQKIKTQVKNSCTRQRIAIGSLVLTLFLVLALAGEYQIDKNKIRKGKIEYRKKNWRMAYRILSDNRFSRAFDKEACLMFGCILMRGYGDPHERLNPFYWLERGGSRDCSSIEK